MGVGVVGELVTAVGDALRHVGVGVEPVAHDEGRHLHVPARRARRAAGRRGRGRRWCGTSSATRRLVVGPRRPRTAPPAGPCWRRGRWSRRPRSGAVARSGGRRPRVAAPPSPPQRGGQGAERRRRPRRGTCGGATRGGGAGSGHGRVDSRGRRL